MAPNKSRKNLNNPRNSESKLFKKLTRIFSGPIVNYKRQTERNLRRKNLSKHDFFSTSGQQFKKEEYNPFKNLQYSIMANQSRAQRYADFVQMEYYPELASALDIYADEMTTFTQIDPLLRIKCSNQEIKDVLQNLYFNILNLDFNLFGWCRTMCKYGDFFLYLDIDDKEGIKYAIGLPPMDIQRIEGEDETNPNYVQFAWDTGGVTFENWQVAHFRILGNDKYAPYGSSTLDSARRIWRQLTMLENAVMSYRIVRSPERRVFYIDVGNIAPQDVEQYMQKVMTTMKRNQIVDSDTGRVDLRYNEFSTDEDFYIPIRGGQNTKVETLAGGQYTGDVDDIKYFRDKLFSAIKIPMSYLIRGEGGDEDKTTLAQKDIRFARTVQRLQRSVVSELEKIGIIHLYIMGYRGEDLLSFSLGLNNPSKLAELQELENWRTKFDVASSATEGFFSRRWISENIFNQSQEEYLRCQREMYFDRYFDAELETTAEGGGDLEGFAGEDVGDEDFGEEDLGTEEEAGDEGEDETLLAAPGKRDEPYLTPGAKGKIYKPVKSDKRDMGARKRNYQSKYAKEVASSSKRNVFKGGNELSSFAKGIYEQKDSNYNKEEKVLLEKTKEVENLIGQLDIEEPKEEKFVIGKEIKEKIAKVLKENVEKQQSGIKKDDKK